MNRYQLTFNFLPELIERYKIGSIDLTKLNNIAELKGLIQEQASHLLFDIDEIAVETIPVSDNIKFIVYTLPEPIIAPEGKYAVIVLDDLLEKTHYYILEKTNPMFGMKIEWMLGGKHTLETHNNYGPFKQMPDKASLINAIKKLHNISE